MLRCCIQLQSPEQRLMWSCPDYMECKSDSMVGGGGGSAVDVGRPSQLAGLHLAAVLPPSRFHC